MAQATALFLSPDEREAPDALSAWCAERGIVLTPVRDGEELLARALRGRPRLVAFDGRGSGAGASFALCRRLKADSFTAIVPAVTLVAGTDTAPAFSACTDEVLHDGMTRDEIFVRLDVLLRRSDRDAGVHPSTRLPGTVEIEREIARRIAQGELFGVCYADLDHFKEFNDRYSYYDGDRVIRILAKILHDVVKGMSGEDGFVGHIGGDDFIFIVPVPDVSAVCEEIVSIFDNLIPYQYSEQDRRAGYFFGKDRRGQLHRVPLMTVSIGVVTNERRHFTHAGQVSELATEMKSYAKTLTGSVFTIDRRQDPSPDDADTRAADRLGVGEIP